MKLIMTGLISLAVTSWLFAQESTSTAVNIHTFNQLSKSYNNSEGEIVASTQNAAPFRADFQMLAELGYGPGGSDDLNNLLLAEVIGGFLLSPEFYVGIGSGVRVMSLPKGFWTNSLGSAVVPIFADVRFFLSQGKASPYISVDAGYSLDVDFGVEGLGFMIRPMAGLSFLRHTKNPLHMGIGYNSQMIKNHDTMGTVVFCMGITF